MTVKLFKMKASLCFCGALLVSSVAFGDVRVPTGDMKLESGDLRISGQAKGIVFPDSSMQTTAAPANLKTILNGPGKPNVLNGVDGDFYIDTTSSTLYGPKTLGAWPDGISLIGPQGIAGTPGTAGSTGPAGANYTLPKAPVLATGQVKSYADGDDGDWMPGVSLPASQRFYDNGDGTVKDNLTGLIWLKDAGCYDKIGGIVKGVTVDSSYLSWANALTWSKALASGSCSLSDGSTAGQWRLPNRKELLSLVDLSKYSPALPTGHPFSNVRSSYFWSGSTYTNNTTDAWYVGVGDGNVGYYDKTGYWYVWPVRAGQ
jgi:hypothetical protein